MKGKGFWRLGVSIVVLAAVLLAGGAAFAEKTHVLKVSSVLNDKDPIILGLLEMQKAVAERSNGRLAIEVYPSSQLGSTDDSQEQAKMGANVAVVTDAARLADIVKEIGILGAPYIVDDYKGALKLVKSDVFKSWAAKLEPHGYKSLSFNWYQGTRHFMGNKPLTTQEEMRGVRTRTPGSPVWRESVAAMGATPVDISWAEVYPGMQQKVIDAFEAQYPAIVGASLFEVAKVVSKTGHFQLMTGLVCGKKFFDSLPEDLQVILLEEAEKAGDYATEMTASKLSEYEEMMKGQGVTFLDVDIAPFKAAVEPVYEKLGLTEARKRVLEVLAK